MTPLVVAHRGAPEVAPENTLDALDAAVALGADAVELDVRVTGDGHLVAFHDVLLDRMTDGRGPLATQSLARVARLRVHGGGRIPLLVEALDLLRGRAQAFVELKPEPHVTPSIFAAAALRARAAAATPLDELVLLSFDPRLLLAARARAGVRAVPHLPHGRSRPPWAWMVGRDDAALRGRLPAREPSRLLVYTVNDTARMATLAHGGTAAIVTDRPGVLRELVRSFPLAA